MTLYLSHPDAVVVAKGDFPTTPHLLQLLHEAPHLVVCDGAIASLREYPDLHPHCIIGDGDSATAEALHSSAPPYLHIPDQETNDLTKAVTYCAQQGWRRLVILGATGRREDHTIGNIFLLLEYHRQGLQVCMASDHGQFVTTEGMATLALPLGTQLSFFAYPGTTLSATGVAYPFEPRQFAALWQATLNATTSPTVQLWSDAPILLYIANEHKSPL